MTKTHKCGRCGNVGTPDNMLEGADGKWYCCIQCLLNKPKSKWGK